MNSTPSPGQNQPEYRASQYAPSPIGPSSAGTTRANTSIARLGRDGVNPMTSTLPKNSNKNKIKISCVKSFTAHEAGITAMICVEDKVDNNTFLMTGSFDRTVKIWSSDGKCRHVVDMAMYTQDFCNTVTAISWNEKTRTAWIACESQSCLIFDPKTNENVSDFLAINFDTNDSSGSGTPMAYATGKSQSTKFGLCTIKNIKKQKIMQLAYGGQTNKGQDGSSSGIMVAGTISGKLIFWRYQPAGFLTAIKSNTAIESLAYCKKAPILIFSGGVEGDISKWERQACTYMYELNLLPYFEVETRMKIVRKQLDLQGRSDHTQPSSDYVSSGNKKVVPGVTKIKSGQNQPKAKTILRLLYHEKKDLLVSACEDTNIYIWGFDEDQIKAYSQMAKTAKMNMNNNLAAGDSNSRHGQGDASDDVTNRVAGFICQYVFFGHDNIVTSLAQIGPNLLLSSSWDKRLFVWDLDELDFVGALTTDGTINKNSSDWADAADFEVIDICAAESIDRIALASTDSCVYIREFKVETIRPKSEELGEISIEEMVLASEAQDLSLGPNTPAPTLGELSPSPNHGPNGPNHTKNLRKKSFFNPNPKLASNSNKNKPKIEYKISCPLIGALKHEHEVNAVCYSKKCNWWITASQDERIRIWDANSDQKSPDAEKLHKKVYEILCNCPVSVLCLDNENEVILAGLDNMINIYDLYTGKLLQVKSGHSENVRCILSIPERSQYISGSWDRQVLIWPAYKKPKSAFQPIEERKIGDVSSVGSKSPRPDDSPVKTAVVFKDEP